MLHDDLKDLEKALIKAFEDLRKVEKGLAAEKFAAKFRVDELLAARDLLLEMALLRSMYEPKPKDRAQDLRQGDV